MFDKRGCPVILSVPEPRFVNGEDKTVHCNRPLRYTMKEDRESGLQARVYQKFCDSHMHLDREDENES